MATKLNVVVHGLWAIEMNADEIVLRTVRIHHHVTKAGSWNPEFDIDQLGHDRLDLKGAVGASAGDYPEFDFRKNPFICGDDPYPHQANKISVSVHLPYPKKIHSLRRRATGGENRFPRGLATPPEVSMVQALVYDVPDLSELKLYPLVWDPETSRSRTSEDTVNLYLYAQPGPLMKIPNYHFIEAFLKLADAYRLTVIQAVGVGADPTDPGIDGLDEADMRGLHEREGTAGSPANCDFFVFDNRPREG